MSVSQSCIDKSLPKPFFSPFVFLSADPLQIYRFYESEQTDLWDSSMSSQALLCLAVKSSSQIFLVKNITVIDVYLSNSFCQKNNEICSVTTMLIQIKSSSFSLASLSPQRKLLSLSAFRSREPSRSFRARHSCSESRKVNFSSFLSASERAFSPGDCYNVTLTQRYTRMNAKLLRV